MLKLKNIIIMIFLSVGFLIIPGSVLALNEPINPPELDTLYPLLRASNKDVVVMYSIDKGTYYAIGTSNSSLNSNINSSYITSGLEGTIGFNNFTNYYGVSSLNVNGDVFKYVNNSWTTLCTFCTFPAGPVDTNFNKNLYIYAWLKGPTSSDTYTWVGNNWTNPNDNTNVLFNINYNLNHYKSIFDLFDTSSAYSYLTTPTNVYASHTGFETDDLEIENYSMKLNDFNLYMYKALNTSDENRQIGARFNYDFQNDNNYELGFVLTYKSVYSESENNTFVPSIVVQAKTKTGVYKCNTYSVKVDTLSDISYQQYVNCPSIALTSADDDFIDIIVQGFNDTTINTNMTNYNYNELFNSDVSYFGISPILKRVTDTEPVPVVPDDTPDDNDIVNGITDINDSINSNALPSNLENLVDFAGYLPPGPVDSILTLPLTFMNNYYSAFTSSSCNAINVPIPYLEDKYITIPCGNTLIDYMGVLNWWETIGTFFGGYCLYKYLINLYKWVDETLTLRENNWPDWGGI